MYTWNDLEIRYQYRTVPKRTIDHIIGYDTETKDGKALLICSSTEALHPTSFGDIMYWLTEKRRRGKTGFFFNMKYDAQAILKWLLDDGMEELWRELHIRQRLAYGPFELFYLSGKMLSIRRRMPKGKSSKFDFYDISQFFGRRSLDDVAKEYLGEGKVDHGYDLANLPLAAFNDPTFIAYCQDDARKAEELARVWLSICAKQQLAPHSLASPATVSARYFADHTSIPTVNAFTLTKERPKLRYSYEAQKGAFISVFKRGYFPEAWEYDINSAYPYAMTLLPDITAGRLVKRKKVIDDAPLGWLRCRIHLDGGQSADYHPPFAIRSTAGVNYYPIGTFRTYLTLLEYLAYRETYHIDVQDGVYWLPDGELTFPYRHVIEDLYAKRLATEDPHENYFSKIMLNGWYGKHLEKHEVLDPDHEHYGKYLTGRYWNPMYGSYILAHCRVQVWTLLGRIPNEDIIAVSTDSVVTMRPRAIPEGKVLGAWSPAGQGELLMVGSGVYSWRYPDGDVVTRNRGFHLTRKLDLFQKCQETWEALKIEIEQQRALSMMESLVQHRPADMNKILDVPRQIDINFDDKRLWIGSFTNADDMLSRWIDSHPPLEL